MQRPYIILIKPLRSILHIAKHGTARGLPSRLSGRDLEADVAFAEAAAQEKQNVSGL